MWRILRREDLTRTSHSCCIHCLALPCCNIPRHFCGLAANELILRQSQRTPGVMVSAGFCEKATPQVVGPLFIEDSCKIDSGVYCRILEGSCAPAMSPIPAPVVWQEDNAPSHRSKATRNWKDAPGKAVSVFNNRLQQCLDADGGHFKA